MSQQLWKERKIAEACLTDRDIHEVATKISYIRSLKGFRIDNFQQVSEQGIKKLEEERPTTRMLSIHTINGCNLACRACNHNSSLLSTKSTVDIDQVLHDMEEVLPKIYVWSHISIIGGEPLMEPRTREVTKRARELVESTGQPCVVKLFSNGSRLLQEKEWIVDEMLKGVVFRLTFHFPWYTMKGVKNWENAYEFVKYAEERGVDINGITLELSEAFRMDNGQPRVWFDLFKYDYTDGIKYYPYEDHNIEESFKHCSCPNSQLYNGHLWKCPMMSYLRESLEATNQLDDPKWQKYLKYKPTSITASDEDLRASFKEVLEPTWICDMCSANPKWFTAAQQLDASHKKTIEMINPSNYESV